MPVPGLVFQLTTGTGEGQPQLGSPLRGDSAEVLVDGLQFLTGEDRGLVFSLLCGITGRSLEAGSGVPLLGVLPTLEGKSFGSWNPKAGIPAALGQGMGCG